MATNGRDWGREEELKFIVLLRVCLGVVFLWFGALKFFPGLSPAEELAASTIRILTLGVLSAQVSLYVLAAWECLIGLGLMMGVCMRATLVLLFLQMAGTMSPVALMPDQVFTRFPFGLTLQGQYIIKNLVLISAGLVIASTREVISVSSLELARRMMRKGQGLPQATLATGQVALHGSSWGTARGIGAPPPTLNSF